MDTITFKYTFLDKIKKIDVQIVSLEDGGHYPVEQAALDQMLIAIVMFINKVLQ